jgi:hypothetical protein
MGNSIPDLIVILFALLLAGLLVALIFRRDFRDAVLGGPGEASVLGILTVKGVAIVLLCGLLIGAILFALIRLHVQPPATTSNASSTSNPIDMRLNVHFDPNDVNPRNPKFRTEAYIKTADGSRQIPVVATVVEGALSIRVMVPNMDTPFFLVFRTPTGTWQTDDYSIKEAPAVAHKQGQE